MSGVPEPDVVLDCRDDPCPLPVIRLGRAIADVEVGGVIAVLARDVAARVDVPAWCRMRSQEFVGETILDDVATYLVRRVS